MRQARHYKGSLVNEATRWGSHLTADFITTSGDGLKGVKGYRHIFVVGDLWSGLWHAYPTKSRAAEEVATCLKEFCGERGATQVHALYSDCGKEILSCLRHFGILHTGGQPGIKKSNALVVSRNARVQETMRTLLDSAGLPSCFWSYVAP